MARRIIVAGCLNLLVYGCVSFSPVYVATSPNMDVGRAQEVVKGLLTSGAVVYGVVTRGERTRIDDVRLRRDGMMLLHSSSVKACYFGGISDNPTVEYGSGALVPYGIDVCNFYVAFNSLSDAKAFADALYVLKVNSRR